MPIANLKNISALDLNRTVWRYLTAGKYLSLIAYEALWFAKLNILVDEFEGDMPRLINAKMKDENQDLKRHFHLSLHDQIDQMNERNINDGRELTVVNCWFMDEVESAQMWEGYVGSKEGVAVKSTVRSLINFVRCDPRLTTIGKVLYVDFETHEMSSYEANQAQERAFLKSSKFRHEKEIRIATMSLRGPMCVGMDGEPLTQKDYEGAGMNNFDFRGLYIKTDLRQLVQGTVLAPGADSWFENTVRRVARLSGIGPRVERSALEKSQAG